MPSARLRVLPLAVLLLGVVAAPARAGARDSITDARCARRVQRFLRR